MSHSCRPICSNQHLVSSSATASYFKSCLNTLCLFYFVFSRGATKGGWRVLKHPQPKIGVPCNSARSDDFFLLGGDLYLHYYGHFRIFTTPSQTHMYQTIPACLYFKIHRQLAYITIVEVLSEGTLLMSVADIHVN